MARTLLLCFIHGFKGNDNTFRNFPDDLKKEIAEVLPDHQVESVVYPKYETKGELAQSTAQFLEWLKSQVMDLRKARVEKPWPPHDRDVGVVLVAHSMGGFVAADALCLVLNEHAASETPNLPLFPLIHGVLSYDTPYNGLSRSMFVYGAFSNYQKVSSVFNVMTALAAGPAALGKLATGRVRGAAMAPPSAASASRNPGWKAWQLIAVKTGTVGAIAAGGVAAYVHRREIMAGLSTVRHLNKQSLVDGYQSGVDALGQGLAYVNRGNVGESLAWLSDHFTFVGALAKPTELNRRLERLAALRGVGLRDTYASLGENGVWTGGYFVPERTFCAVPQEGQPAAALFTRCVVRKAEDEVQAHMSMFDPQRNLDYTRMLRDSAERAAAWFASQEPVVDDPKFALPPDPEPVEEAAAKAIEGGAHMADAEKLPDAAGAAADVPDESPVDIAAAASLVPLPDEEDDGGDAAGGVAPSEHDKATYLRHLFGVAQQAGTGIKRMSEWSSGLPAKMPRMEGLGTLPSMPVLPKPTMPNLPTMPSMNIFGRKQQSEETGAEETNKAVQTAPDGAGPGVEGDGEKLATKTQPSSSEGSGVGLPVDSESKEDGKQ